MKILVVEDESITREVVISVVENVIPDAEILQCVNSTYAIKIFKTNPDIDIIVSDNSMTGGNGVDLYNFIVDSDYDPIFILSSSDDLETLGGYEKIKDKEKDFAYIKKPLGPQNLIDTLTVLLTKRYQNVATEIKENYVKVRIPMFFRNNVSGVDVFCKLSDVKYVKIINAGEPYAREEVLKYTKRKLKYLYVKKEDFDEFLNDYGKDTFLSLVKIKDPKERFEATTSSLEVIHYLANEVGIDQDVVDRVDGISDGIIKDLSSKDTLGHLILSFSSRRDYLKDHSYFLSYICALMCEHIEWAKKEVTKKLIFASLLHDILIEDLEVATVMEEKNLNPNLPKDVIENYLNHPKETFDILEASKLIPENVAELVLKHHELPDGSGFPSKLNKEQVSPLEGLFILAHYFVSSLHDKDFDRNLVDEITQEVLDKFNHGNYKKSLPAFKKVIEELKSFTP